ncbi:RICIN domain-containing protein [Streptomyces sp. NPDC051183]|uniref:RICIN domain-containing protein n=1 Tax=unclassified Streptomyces TaxID=2593676 RepID=UPI00342410BA
MHNAKRRTRTKMAVTGLVAALTVGFPAAAPAQAAAGFKLTGYDSRKCLDVRGGVSAAGQDMQVWHCHGGAGQRWTWRGASLVSDLRPDLCLDVRGGVATPGQDVQIWDCNGGAGQRWTVRSGVVLVSDLRPDLCLDARGGPGIGQDVQIWSCNGAIGQRWYRTA